MLTERMREVERVARRRVVITGAGLCLYVARLLVSLRHFAIHARSACVLHHLFTVDRMVNSWGGGSAGC